MRITHARSMVDAYLSRVYSLLVSREFKRFDQASVSWSARVTNPQFIELGRGVSVRPGSWVYAVASDPVGSRFTPHIVIDDGTYLGHNLHLTAIDEVVIERDVMIADGVYISDNFHDFRDVSRPVLKQRVFSRGPLRIRQGAFIGEGARVLGPVTVGRNAVIGCSAVVTRDVPDFSVATGVPARVIQRWDAAAQDWIRVDGGDQS